MPTDSREHEARQVEAIRQTCIRAAIEAYEDAGIRGLCAEGRWEAAVAAIRTIDLRTSFLSGAGPHPRA